MAQAELKNRPRYKPKQKQPILPWTVDLTRKLIDFYRVNRILWDPACAGSKNIAQRDAAINSYLETNSLTQIFSLKDVKTKWKVLRTIFWDIYKKTNEKRLRSGKYGEEDFIPSWPYYKSMSFMTEIKEKFRSSATFTTVQNSFEDESIDFVQELPVETSCNDEEDDLGYSPQRLTNGGISSTTIDYKAEIEEISDEIFVEENQSQIDAASASGHNQHSNGHFFDINRKSPNLMEYHFGKYVCAKLQEMDTKSRDLAQFEIMQVLMKYKYPESVVQQ